MNGKKFSSHNAKGVKHKVKLLGFHLDPLLTGTDHLKACMDKAKGRLSSLGHLAKSMGEEHALNYLRTTVAPSALFGLSLVRHSSMQRSVLRVWESALGEATMVGESNRWWSADPLVSRRSLPSFTSELPWDLQVLKSKAGLCAKLPSVPGSLASSIYACCGGSVPFLSQGVSWLKKHIMGHLQPHLPKSRILKYKRTLADTPKKAAHSRIKELHLQTHVGRSDALMLRVLENAPWPALDKVCRQVPSLVDRVALHKVKLGAIKNTKVSHSRALASHAQWRSLPLHVRQNAVMCDCGAGAQSPYHLFSECALAKPFLVCGFPHLPAESAMDVWVRVLSAVPCAYKHLLFNFRFFSKHFLRDLDSFKSQLPL